jgi:hypothetical protein
MGFFRGICMVCGLVCALSVVENASGQSYEDVNTLFQTDSVLNLTLTFNFDSLFSKNYSESTLYPAVLTFPGNNAVRKKIRINISKRGHFRKSFDVCDFPPLRLQFDKKAGMDSVFNGLSKLKLITHCQNSDTAFDQNILMEYYLYKMYNLLTWRSFNVRLARIRYIDRVKTYEPMDRWAFFIENPANLAARINGKILNIKYITPEATDPYSYTLMSLFQYMIINQDWSIGLLHNIELVGIYPGLKPVTIPFDLDMSAMLNIPYNSALLDYRKGRKQERKFMASKIKEKYLYQAIFQFIKERNNIYGLINESKYLTDSVKSQMIAHLDDFYSIIGDKKQVPGMFIHPR